MRATYRFGHSMELRYPWISRVRVQGLAAKRDGREWRMIGCRDLLGKMGRGLGKRMVPFG